MLGGLGNLTGLMRQMKDMQSRFKEVQQRVAASRFEADSGAGAVRAVVNGTLELVELRITAETIQSGDVEMIEDLVRSAVRAAQSRAAEGVRAEMQTVTGGISLPGLEGLLGGGAGA
jgi:hypothetical protein